jgi:serine/threonine-protein kinase
MSYCLNPNCIHPENLASSRRCNSCGSPLLLRDRYRVIKPLGQGGFGATFLAQDEVLPGQPCCVIKQLRPSGTAPHILQMAGELFEREAKTLGKIGNHPQIPRLLDYFEDRQQFYLVQEYISGSTLQQEVKQKGVYTEHGVRQFLSEILPLLKYIHERKVIHRDIKPANLIRRTQDGRLVLIDFGAVKDQVSQAAGSQSGHTALTAYAIGTPGFAPPEQMAMRPVYASDIYALGVTCIYLLTAKTPKDLEYNPTTGDMLWEHLVNISEHLTKVLKKMLEVSVRNRYHSAMEVLGALDIEPYLNSLSEGLLVQNSQRPDNSTSWNSNSTANRNENVAKIAAAIRARRAKGGESVGLGMGRTQHGEMASKATSLATSNSNGSHIERKLDAQTLLAAYSKGRRDFASYNLSLLSLVGVDLSGTNFNSAQLRKTNLHGSNLNKSDFGRASLVDANLRDTNLTKAYFSNADLAGADLRGADLSHAYLSNANLRGANLCGANLTGAKVTEEQLSVAKTNWLTIRPNGKRGLL